MFSLTPPASPGGAWTETVLHGFAGGHDGSYPTGIVIGPDALYGTTSDFYGNYPSGAGTVFSLKPPASAGGSCGRCTISRWMALMAVPSPWEVWRLAGAECFTAPLR